MRRWWKRFRIRDLYVEMARMSCSEFAIHFILRKSVDNAASRFHRSFPILIPQKNGCKNRVAHRVVSAFAIGMKTKS